MITNLIGRSWRPRAIAASAAALVALAAGPAGGATASGGAAQPLSIEDALARALAKSPAVREAENESRRARLESKVALSPFLPQLALEGGRQEKRSDEQVDAGNFGYLSAQYNVFNGWRDRRAREERGIEAGIAETRLGFVKARTVKEVARHYLESLYLAEIQRLKEEAVEVNETQIVLARRRVQGGFASGADILEFEFRENSLRTELALLRHRRNVATRALNEVIGEEPDRAWAPQGSIATGDEWLLDPVTRAIGATVTPEVNGDGTLAALDQRIEWLEARRNLELARVRERAAVATWLPRLDLEGRYGAQEHADPEVRGEPGLLFQVRLTVPLFSGLETVYARQVQAAEAARAEAAAERARLALASQRSDIKEKLEVLAELVRLQKTNIERARRYYDATVSEYKRGVKNSPDLAGATERLFAARERDLELKRDLFLARLGVFEDLSTGID